MSLTESEIKVIIAAEVRKAGFDKAARQTSLLEKQFKKLGSTLIAAFSVQKVIAFGKASVKAFAEDEKAARRLTQTLSSMNLAFEDPRIQSFIATLEQQSGVLDDKLRPAMESLLRTTGSVLKSQKLLTLAIDVAAGSGQDLTTVASDLSKAYVGNTRGLIKYNLGLTKTELAGKSFLDIQKLLTEQYSGQNAAYLETYEGKVSQLRVAYMNMQETIGKGLVDAFARLAGENGIPSATNAMKDFALYVSDTVTGVSILIDYLNKIPGLEIIKGFNLSNFGILGVAQALGRKDRVSPKPFKTPMTISGQSDLYAKQDRERAKVEKESIKRQKQLLAMQKKADLEKARREKLLLAQKRANTIFDLDNIQIVAALQGKIDGEERARLVALLALNTDNYVAAEKLADVIIRLNAPALQSLGVLIEAGDTVDDIVKKLIKSQAGLAGLQLAAEDFPELENPFDEWEKTLQEILRLLKEIANTKVPEIKPGGGVGGSAGNLGNYGGGATQMPDYSPNLGDRPLGTSQPTPDVSPNLGNRPLGSSKPTPDVSSNLGNRPLGATRPPLDVSPGLGNRPFGARNVNVNVNVAGNVTTQNDLVSSITNALYQRQKDGQSILYSSTAI